MKREERIESAAQDIFFGNPKKDIERLERQIDENFDVIFKKIMFDFHQFFQLISSKKKRIESISIYFLHATVLSGEYYLQVEAYGSGGTIDEEIITSTIDVSLVLKGYEEEFDFFQREMEKRIIQLRYDEIMRYHEMYEKKYFHILGKILETILPHVTRLRSFLELDISEKMYFTYGEFYSEVLWMLNYGEDVADNEILFD